MVDGGTGLGIYLKHECGRTSGTALDTPGGKGLKVLNSKGVEDVCGSGSLGYVAYDSG